MSDDGDLWLRLKHEEEQQRKLNDEITEMVSAWESSRSRRTELTNLKIERSGIVDDGAKAVIVPALDSDLGSESAPVLSPVLSPYISVKKAVHVHPVVDPVGAAHGMYVLILHDNRV